MNQTVFANDIVNLNVGGTRFSTSRHTLCSVPDSFFSSLLSGRIPSYRDETGALFIDRDPKYFGIILHFLRTKEIDLNEVNISLLKHEAEFYGIMPLVKRLWLCEDLDRSLCGDLLFTGYIPFPSTVTYTSNVKTNPVIGKTNQNKEVHSTTGSSKPGNVFRLGSNNNATNAWSSGCQTTTNGILHSRNSSIDLQIKMTHSRKSSNETFNPNTYIGTSTSNFNNTSSNNLSIKCHSRNQSFDFKQLKGELGILLSDLSSNSLTTTNLQVNLIVGHLNWICVAYSHFICCYKLKDGLGWHLMFKSAMIEEEIERLAINSKHQMTSSILTNNNSNSCPNSPVSTQSNIINSTNTSNQNIINSPTQQQPLPQPQHHHQFNSDNPKNCALVALAFKAYVRLWLIGSDESILIGNFNLNINVDNLFFIGSQLVATSCTGKIGVWNSLSQLWQTQDLTPISSFDTAGNFLLLGCKNGSLYYIDMQKFPLRMKDNDLLVTELYKDPLGDSITALSVYLTPKTTNIGNWIEIAYGTHTGHVRVIVQHPETVGHGPQLFQSFFVHRSPIVKVMLTEKYLVSVCAESFHVRTWNVTRFRGMISTQPGSTPCSSFKIVTIDALDSPLSYSSGNDIGPFGDKDNYQVFIQKVVPYTDQLFVRLSSTGKRICSIKSVDYSTITCYCVHECDGPSRLNSRPRRYLFTGHLNGSIQLWDLTTALELKPSEPSGGPSPSEFVKLLDQCDLATYSGYSTPTTNCMISPCTNFSLANSKHKNLLINSSVNFVQTSNSQQSFDENERH